MLAGISNNERSTPYDKYFSQHIKGYHFKQIYLDQLMVELSPKEFKVSDSRSGELILDYDMVMIREYGGHFLDLAFVVARYLKSHNIHFFNHNYLTYRPVSKIAQAVLFYERGINFPATYFSLNGESLAGKAEGLGYPYILKDRLGMHGSDNHLVRTKDEALAVLRGSGIKFIAQEFLPNTHDYRILLMGAREPLQIKRTAAAGSHLNNTSQGGTGQLVKELPEQVLMDARKLTKDFAIDVGGVDVLQSQADNRYYFLEVNNQPQLATGAEVPAKLERFKDFLDSELTG